MTTDLQTWLEESHFIYKNTENQTVEGEEAWRRISLADFIPIVQRLEAPGGTCQDVRWQPLSEAQCDLWHAVRCFVRCVSQTIAVWFLSGGGTSQPTFCGEQRLPSCCYNVKDKKIVKQVRRVFSEPFPKGLSFGWAVLVPCSKERESEMLCPSLTKVL